MRSLKARLMLLVGSAALLVLLAGAGLSWAVRASEQALERTLSAQARLDLLAELSGRLADFGLAAVDAVSAPSPRPERVAAGRSEVERSLAAIEARFGTTASDNADRASEAGVAARRRALTRLRAAFSLLDHNIEQAIGEGDPALRNDGVRGALNAFGAVTGPSLSFLIEAERRSVAAASAEAQALSDRLRIGALIGAGAALLGAGLTHRTVTRPLLDRIEAIRRAASAIGHGKLGTRLSVTSRDELGLLIASFNRMAARLARRERHVVAARAALEETVARRTADVRAANQRLEAIDQSRRRFFADVSHELRTPLTVILGECDVSLKAPAQAPDAYRRSLTTIRERAQRLHRRVEDLLRVARSESGQIELDLKPTSPRMIVDEAVESFAAEARRRGVLLERRAASADPAVVADREWLRQVIEILIENALRHASGATRIVVAVRQSSAGAEIAVEDDGPGFPREPTQLFDRFARAGEGSGAPGFGIGLALARWVVERHHGAIRLESARFGGGARVVVTLPVAREENVA
jgi:two-component system, OmpR family, sensor kinase